MRKRSAVRSTNELLYARRAEVAVDVLFRGKWQIALLCAMRGGSVRIGQLSRSIPGASKKVLAQSLRRLEADGIIIRRDLSDQVLHVEYNLHPDKRDSVICLLDSLSSWSERYLRTNEANDHPAQ